MIQGIKIGTVALLWLLLSTMSSVQAQSAGDINPLSQWRENWSQLQSTGHIYAYYKYYIDGDTLIDSNIYYKVYWTGYYEYDWGNPIYFDLFKGVLREEENRWYTIYYGNEECAYDFNLEIGDSFIHYLNSTAMITVIDIDTIFVDGEPKKKFYLVSEDLKNCITSAKCLPANL